MNQQLQAILTPSLFYAWAKKTQPSSDFKNITPLIEEGSEGKELLLLIEGYADVTSEGRSGETSAITQLEAPALFGEMSFLEGRVTVANVIGQAGSRWIRIPFSELNKEIDKNADFAADFYNVLARKLALQLQSQNSMVHRWEISDIEPLRKVLLIFAELIDLDIDWLLKHGKVINYQPGEEIIRQGEKLDQLWLVLEGDADILVINSETPQKVGSSRRGEFLGEMSLLSEDNRAAASVIAHSKMQMLCIQQQQLRLRMESDTEFSARFHRSLAMLLSHRCRDQLMRHGLASRAAANEAISFDTLENISQAGRRFDWLCRQLATA